MGDREAVKPRSRESRNRQLSNAHKSVSLEQTCAIREALVRMLVRWRPHPRYVLHVDCKLLIVSDFPLNLEERILTASIYP